MPAARKYTAHRPIRSKLAVLLIMFYIFASMLYTLSFRHAWKVSNRYCAFVIHLQLLILWHGVCMYVCMRHFNMAWMYSSYTFCKYSSRYTRGPLNLCNSKCAVTLECSGAIRRWLHTSLAKNLCVSSFSFFERLTKKSRYACNILKTLLVG